MKLTQIREGTTDLTVPKASTSHKKGPGTTSKTAVFFNPVMELSRDVSILVLSEFTKGRRARLLDGLAATGARGVRVANEIVGDFSVVINDHNPKAVEIIEKNLKLNNLENCVIENKKMNTLLSQEYFDYVDIDPFGSPVQFIDASFQSLRKNGVLAVTATDSAPLCAASKKACLRRYDARSIKTVYSKELGARILAGFCVRSAARHELALTPILTFFADHYIRIHFDVDKGAGRTDEVLKNLGYILHNRNTGERRVEHDIPAKIENELFCGPLWIGNLHKKSLLSNIQAHENLGTEKRLSKYIDLWRGEIDMPPFFYDLNEISSLTKTQPFPIVGMIDILQKQGFLAGRTHFSPTGFKTDATMKEISDLVAKR